MTWFLKKILLVFICVSFSEAFSQQQLNLNFEKESVEGYKRPWGWYKTTWGSTLFHLDSSTVKEGERSLVISCPGEDTCNSESLRFDLEPYEFSGKQITVSGYYKSNQEHGDISISIGYAVLVSDHNYEEKEISSQIKKQNQSWDTISVSIDIPANARTLFVKINYQGKGNVWMDDLKLTCEGKSFTEVQVAKPFTKKQEKWFEKKSTPLLGVTVQENNEDLSEFLKHSAAAKIIALGESTHGTSEFFSLKHRLLAYLVEEVGFRIFAIEDNMVLVEMVNQYVLTGEGTALESMEYMFGVWYKQEVLKMIQWVRLFNEENPTDPVYFVGFDMQDVVGPSRMLTQILAEKRPVLYETQKPFLDELIQNANAVYYANDSQKLDWFNRSKELEYQIQLDVIFWKSNEKNPEEKILTSQYATLIRQFCESLYKGQWSQYRDEAMAANIQWTLETRYPGKKMVIWAHDSHISKCQHPNANYNLHFSISMGSFLEKKYGTDYKAYSLSTYSGYYSALVSYTDFTRVQAPLYPAPIGSFDEMLHRIAQKKSCKGLFIILDKELEWLNNPTPKRFANHVSIDYGFYEQISLPMQFDGIFFLDETSGSKKIE